jgi:Tfp pilus assembly protein FimT
MAARTKAVNDNRRVTLCASSNRATCNSNDYKDGWIIIADTDADGVVDTVTKVQDPITVAEVQFQLSDASMATIAFDSSGFNPNSVGDISIFDSRGVADASAKSLNVSRTGRVRSQ